MCISRLGDRQDIFFRIENHKNSGLGIEPFMTELRKPSLSKRRDSSWVQSSPSYPNKYFRFTDNSKMYETAPVSFILYVTLVFADFFTSLILPTHSLIYIST